MLRAKTNLTRWDALASAFIFLAFSAFGASTNSSWFYRAWQSDEGLPDNMVTGIAQTPDGFLWVATPGGLAHFDGVRFQDFSPVNTAGTPTSVMQALLLDRRGRLWLAKDLGAVVCLDNGRLTAFTSENGLPRIRVTVMVEDGTGAIWIAYADGQLARIQDGKVNNFTSANGWIPDPRTWLASDKLGQLWYTKKGEVGVFRRGKFVPLQQLRPDFYCITAAQTGGVWISGHRELWKIFDTTDTNGLVFIGLLPAFWPSANTTALYEDGGGAVWIGTAEAGLIRYDASGFVNVKTSHREILSVSGDHEGNIWVGTRTGGLNRLRRSALALENALPDLPTEAVLSVCQETNGSLWAATQSGLVTRYEDDAWNILSTDPDWLARYANCICPADEGVWIGTQHRGLVHWRADQTNALRTWDGLASDTVRSLFRSQSGDVWIGTETPNALQCLRAGKLINFPLPTENSAVSAMVEDASHRVWVGTYDGHLLFVNGGRLEKIPASTLPQPQAIRSLAATADGSIWMGSAGRGLGRWKAGVFTRFRTRQGLRDEYISQIVPDQKGRLWLGGNRGLFYVKLVDFDDFAKGRSDRIRSVSYDWDEGLLPLQSSHDHWPGALRSTDGKLWFPTQNGLAVLDPDRVRENPKPPPVLIERVTIDGFIAATYDPIENLPETNAPAPLNLRGSKTRLPVPAGNQQTVFEFTALSFTAPRNIAFKYRLDPLDKGWMDSRGRRSVTYPHLDQGDYRFHVSACNNDGIWNETGAALAIHVLPFFWQTWWFRIPAVVIVLGLNGAAARYYALRRLRRRLEQINRERAVENERSRIAQDIHDDLGANLTEITLLSELAQSEDAPPHEVQSDIRKIAVRARELTRSVDATVWAVNPRYDNFDSFVSYACTYAEDYLSSAGIRLRMEVPAELPSHALPPEVRHNVFLILKEALNNTVKHAAATEVWLRIHVQPDGFSLAIEDNGKGFNLAAADEKAISEAGSLDLAATQKDGLFNMRKRMESVGGQLELTSQPDQGTKIRLQVKFRRRLD